ncbi:MAG: putative permease YjgP/YjgQ family protein [bacterium ADurb.Bin478]|nr:MAG: putative permease YjgP/YjgQ family protein [bacterium ADurb.Bin478]
MRILSRYVLKEHIGPFVFSMCVITLLFILNLVFRDLSRILSKGLSLATVLEFFFLQLAWIIALAAPMSVLVATVMAFGRLSGDQEITAMKASGVSVLTMIKPVLLASMVLTVLMVLFNDHVLPDFNHRARLLTADIYRKKPTIRLEAGVIYRDLPDFTLRVQNIVQKGDTAFVDSVFIDDNSAADVSKIIFAKRGSIFFNQQAEMLLLTLYDGEMHELDLQKLEQYRKLSFPKQNLAVSVPGMALERSDSQARGDREKSSAMMLAEVKNNEQDIERNRRELTQQIADHFHRYFSKPEALAQLSRPADNDEPPAHGSPPLGGILADHLRLQQQIGGRLSTLQQLQRKNSSLMVEVQKKYSIPVACIIFVLIGAPLGIMARRGSLAMAGGISFAFFLLYWTTLIGGEELADKQLISPFAAMWTANILVGIAGLYLVFHSTYEATSILSVRFNKLFKRWMRRPA